MSVDPQRLKELFLKAAEIEAPAERAAFLERECGHDAELRRRVEVLLHAHDDSGGLLAPAPTVDPTPDDDASVHGGGGETVGDVIGPYKLLQKLGEGGMGTVWIAEQHHPVKASKGKCLVHHPQDPLVLQQGGGPANSLRLPQRRSS